MRLYDVEEHAQNSLVDSGQLGSEMKKTTDKLNEKFTKNSSFDDWEM